MKKILCIIIAILLFSLLSMCACNYNKPITPPSIDLLYEDIMDDKINTSIAYSISSEIVDSWMEDDNLIYENGLWRNIVPSHELYCLHNFDIYFIRTLHIDTSYHNVNDYGTCTVLEMGQLMGQRCRKCRLEYNTFYMGPNYELHTVMHPR